MIKKDQLEFMLKENFPELSIGNLWIERKNVISLSDMSVAIRQIRDKKLIQKSNNIFYSNYTDNANLNSIEYKLGSLEQDEGIYFEIEKTKNQDIFKGYFKTIKEIHSKTNDITLHNMHLRD